MKVNAVDFISASDQCKINILNVPPVAVHFTQRLIRIVQDNVWKRNPDDYKQRKDAEQNNSEFSSPSSGHLLLLV